jgi:cyclopropane fatty-acyl-phospholipid synthase-like methyltransferase
VSPSDLDESVTDYFSREGTVSEWWTPDSGPLAFHYAAEVRVLAEQLALDPAWRVLDVGTGRGRFGIFFAERGCRVTGVDLNPDMLEIARETARQCHVEDRFEAVRGSAEDLSQFGDGSFDVVACMELFDHLPDLGRALSEMRRKLKVGGRFVFTYVPTESLYGTLGNVYRWLRARFAPGELSISRTYSLGEVRSQLSERGLRLDDYWGVGVFCANAQTRLLGENAIVRGLNAVARAEASRWPYHRAPLLARHSAHVVGLATAVEADAG